MLHHGVGTRIGSDRVLTAAHVVDGDLRHLDVEGANAEVVALDARLDLAVLRIVAPATASGGTGAAPPPVYSHQGVEDDEVLAIATPAGIAVAVAVRTVTLRVDDVDSGVVHEREAIQLDGDVPRGTSGAPVLDESGAIVGVVVLSDPAGDVTYAVRLPGGADSIGPPPSRRGCTTD